MKTAIFLERDGILNGTRVECRQQVSPVRLEEFRLNPEAGPLLHKLKDAGFVLIATTNQPGLSLGGVTRRELDRMHELLVRSLPLDGIMVCPHAAADLCPCRKPQPGLLTEASFKWHLDLERSFVISDKWQDAAAARTVGATSLLLQSPWTGSGHHDFVLPDLTAIVDRILRLRTSHRILAA